MNSQKINLSTPNMLGGVGGILLTIGPLFFFLGPILILAGLILVLVAFHQYSKILNNPSIFQHGLMWSIAPIVTAVLFILFAGIAASVRHSDGVVAVLLFLSIYGAAIFATINLKKALEELSITLNHNLFNISGKLIFWGTILLIILIGVIVSFVGFIILTVAFFTAPKEIQSEITNSQPEGIRSKVTNSSVRD
jgi:uncharacterized membrane protein